MGAAPNALKMAAGEEVAAPGHKGQPGPCLGAATLLGHRMSSECVQPPQSCPLPFSPLTPQGAGAH